MRRFTLRIRCHCSRSGYGGAVGRCFVCHDRRATTPNATYYACLKAGNTFKGGDHVTIVFQRRYGDFLVVASEPSNRIHVDP